MSKTMHRSIFAFGCALALTACGSGGEGAGDPLIEEAPSVMPAGSGPGERFPSPPPGTPGGPPSSGSMTSPGGPTTTEPTTQSAPGPQPADSLDR